MNIKEIIEKLQFIQDQCENANYSTETAYQLLRLSNELKLRSNEVFQCCT